MKWYKSSIFVTFMMIIFLPVGLILMKKYKNTWYDSFKRKLIIAGAAVLIAEAALVVYAVSTRPTMVWVDDTAEKYHRTPKCSNMDDPYKVTLEQAQKMGKKPCRDCYH